MKQDENVIQDAYARVYVRANSLVWNYIPIQKGISSLNRIRGKQKRDIRSETIRRCETLNF